MVYIFIRSAIKRVYDNLFTFQRVSFPKLRHHTSHFTQSVRGLTSQQLNVTQWSSRHAGQGSSLSSRNGVTGPLRAARLFCVWEPQNSVSAATFGVYILDGHSTVTDNGKPHNTAETTNTPNKYRACIYTTAKIPLFTKVQKNIHTSLLYRLLFKAH
jgi:hypothetical protein